MGLLRHYFLEVLRVVIFLFWLTRDAVVGPGHPDYMELESVASGQSRFTTSPQQLSDHRAIRAPYATYADQKLEPLTPALLRPTKERETNLSKAEERGDRLVGHLCVRLGPQWFSVCQIPVFF